MAEANVTTNKQLPAEVLVKIFAHCDLSELVNIVDVCQLWRDVVIHQHMPRNDLVIRRRDDINNLVSLLRKPVSFTKLHIVWDVPSDVDCGGVSLGALANATSLTHLQSFMFKVKNRDDKVLDALLTLIVQTSTETLTHLKLINTGYNVSWKVMELIETCQHLSHLVFNRCQVFPDYEQRCKDIIPTLSHLELLDLRGTLIPLDLSFIAAVKRGCANIFNNIMIGALYVTPSADMNMLQFVSYVDRLYIKRFNTDQLTTLVSCLSERVSQLSVDELHFDDCKDHITDDILLSLVKCLRGLKVVRAFECGKLTNEGVLNVIRSSPDLERIDIYGVKKIDTGIIQLLDPVVTRKNVEIYAGATKLSDEMRGLHPGRELHYTGRNRNICLRWRS